MEFANDWPLWITEDVTWPVMWGLLLAGILAFVWYITRQSAFFIGAAVTIGLVVFALVVEQKVTTEKEYLTDAIYTMANFVRNNDADGIVQFVRPENQMLIDQIVGTSNQYHFSGCRVIGFSETNIDDKSKSPQMAYIGFAVYASGSFAGRIESTQVGNVAVRLKFKKTNGKWYLEDYGYRPSNVLNEIEMQMEKRGR